MPRGSNDASVPSGPAPSIKVVAEHAGVGVASVSRVFSDHPDVSERMRERVLAAANELGYQPNLFAQGLRTGESRSVGFVVGDIANPLLSEIALGAETALREGGYSMLLANSGTDPAVDAANIRLFSQRRVDGLMLSLFHERHGDTLSALDRAAVPAVLIDRELRDRDDVSAVVSDHRQGMREAVRHLAALGHERIAMIGGNPGIRPERERERAVRQATRRHGMTCTIHPGAYNAEHGAKALTELLDSVERPTAVIAAGNQVLPGVLDVMRSRGLRAPRDLSVITCDELPLSRFVDPPVAALRRDPRDMGRRAAQLLLARLRDDAPAQVATLPVQYHPTASVGAPLE